jgi:hypothetical protein
MHIVQTVNYHKRWTCYTIITLKHRIANNYFYLYQQSIKNIIGCVEIRSNKKSTFEGSFVVTHVEAVPSNFTTGYFIESHWHNLKQHLQ